MHKTALLTLPGLLCLLGWFTSVTAAEDVHLVASLNAGQTTFAFDEKLDQKVTYIMLNPSLTVLRGPVYLSLSFARSVANEDISEEEEVGEASRRDADLTLGYRFSDRWSVFAGYHEGDTDIDFRPRDPEDFTGGGDPPTPFTDTITVSGPFFGVSLSFPSQSAGTATFSLAYAPFEFDGELNSNLDTDSADGVEFDDETGNVSGDATGFSAAWRWSIPLGESLFYSAQLKHNVYQQDVGFAASGNRYKDIEQRVTFFAMGLSWLLF